jgi:phosphate transport system protein
MPIDLRSELLGLRRDILTLGATVEQRVAQSLQALLKHHHDMAHRVADGDSEIDRMEIEIEAECLRILALSQPVAGDLRFVLAVMRINNELERVGDLARSIAKRAMDLDTLRPIEFPQSLLTMADRAREMLSGAIQALADEDVITARRIRAADERVDDLQKEVFHWVQDEIVSNVATTEAALDILSVARKLERIADIATNIAEDVIFLAEGAVVRHTSTDL